MPQITATTSNYLHLVDELPPSKGWIQNPNPDTWPWMWTGAWDACSASFGGLLVKELLGNTDEKGDYVHISDGGHFDNLGVYELVKRRCRYIVAVDATENPLATSDNLGILNGLS